MSSPASVEFLRRRRREGDPRPRCEPCRRIARNGAVDADLARLDQRLEPGARQRDAPRRRRLSEETVEPFARALRVDVENLRPFGRDERRKGRGQKRRVRGIAVNGRGRAAPGALLGFCVHARSRRRGRPALVSSVRALRAAGRSSSRVARPSPCSVRRRRIAPKLLPQTGEDPARPRAKLRASMISLAWLLLCATFRHHGFQAPRAGRGRGARDRDRHRAERGQAHFVRAPRSAQKTSENETTCFANETSGFATVGRKPLISLAGAKSGDFAGLFVFRWLPAGPWRKLFRPFASRAAFGRREPKPERSGLHARFAA